MDQEKERMAKVIILGILEHGRGRSNRIFRDIDEGIEKRIRIGQCSVNDNKLFRSLKKECIQEKNGEMMYYSSLAEIVDEIKGIKEGQIHIDPVLISVLIQLDKDESQGYLLGDFFTKVLNCLKTYISMSEDVFCINGKMFIKAMRLAIDQLADNYPYRDEYENFIISFIHTYGYYIVAHLNMLEFFPKNDNLVGALNNKTREENKASYEKLIKVIMEEYGFCSVCAENAIEFFVTQR